MIFVKKVILGDMEITFKRALQIVGVDEFNVYLQDKNHNIGGLPYIRIFSKQWKFTDAITGCDISFDFVAY